MTEKRVQQARQQVGGMEERVPQAETRANELESRLEDERVERERLPVQLEESGRMLQLARERVHETEEMKHRGKKELELNKQERDCKEQCLMVSKLQASHVLISTVNPHLLKLLWAAGNCFLFS